MTFNLILGILSFVFMSILLWIYIQNQDDYRKKKRGENKVLENIIFESERMTIEESCDLDLFAMIKTQLIDMIGSNLTEETEFINSQMNNMEQKLCDFRMYSKGEILNEKYRVEKILGKGGMGRVYLCTHIELGNLWAVKHIHKGMDKKRLFTAEEDILKKLNSIYLPKIADVFYNDTGTYIVESYIEGMSLDQKMMIEGLFDEKTVIEWAKQLTEALDYLHTRKPKPIIYRDMKPSNVMITKENRAVLIDFGISKEYHPWDASDAVIAATIKYASPEQFGGYADQRSDIYSLGMMLYELLTGRIPSGGRRRREAYPKISREFEEILLKCIHEEPECRYQSAGELREALEKIPDFQRYNKRQAVKNKMLLTASFVLGLISMVMFYRGIIKMD